MILAQNWSKQQDPRDTVPLKKYKSKFDCLIYEMFLINELRPSLNVQSNSILAKVF